MISTEVSFLAAHNTELAKWEEVLRWRPNAIKQFVSRDGSQTGVVWCTSRSGIEFFDGIEGSISHIVPVGRLQ
jgi:hypothetical protein